MVALVDAMKGLVHDWELLRYAATRVHDDMSSPDGED